MHAGDAYADILFGDVVPSGKMPITLPRHLKDNPHVKLNDYNAEDCFYKEGVFMGYRWFEKERIQPAFAFGHGLSYTNFEYSDISISSTDIGSDETLDVTFRIKNIGQVDGGEVAQLYLQDVESSVLRPEKELKGFKKVFLRAGETQAVTLTVTAKDLSFWDEGSDDWRAEPGAFRVHVGSSVADIRLQSTFSLR
jgi:beta-glucosidase